MIANLTQSKHYLNIVNKHAAIKESGVKGASGSLSLDEPMMIMFVSHITTANWCPIYDTNEPDEADLSSHTATKHSFDYDCDREFWDENEDEVLIVSYRIWISTVRVIAT